MTAQIRTTIGFHNAIIDAAEQIRPLPQTVTKLAQLVADPDTPLDEIAATVQEDPALVSALLREANSATSAARDGVGTVEAAIVRLGSARTVAIAVSSSLADVAESGLEGYGIASDEFWNRSKAAMFVAEILAMLCRGRLDRSVVTAAVLHDIGKIVLSPYLKADHYLAALKDTGNEAIAERLLIDIDHAEVGAMLSAHWKLPAPIVNAIKGHPCLDGGETEMARAVHLADFMAQQMLAYQVEAKDPQAVDRAKLTIQQFGIDTKKFVERCEQRLEDAGYILNPTDAITELTSGN
ncbi:MAG: HDOD domain-containing protein [Actinomycetota bacterium]